MQETPETHACPRCAHENDADTRFCGNCGLRIDGLCPNCGTRNEHSIHFCVNCGHDFTAAPAPQATAVGGDLRSIPGPGTTPAPYQQPAYEPRGIECPRCHRANEPRAAFCFSCGLPFDTATGFEERGYVGPIRAYATARPSGFWFRLIATIIDNIILTAIYAILAPLLIDETIGDLFRSEGQSSGSFFLNLALGIGYGTVLIGAYATTVGKRVFGMRVVRPSGEEAGWGRAALREVARTTSFIIFPAAIASAFMVGLRPDKRAIHDLIADTVVPRR